MLAGSLHVALTHGVRLSAEDGGLTESEEFTQPTERLVRPSSLCFDGQDLLVTSMTGEVRLRCCCTACAPASAPASQVCCCLRPGSAVWRPRLGQAWAAAARAAELGLTRPSLGPDDGERPAHCDRAPWRASWHATQHPGVSHGAGTAGPAAPHKAPSAAASQHGRLG